MHRNVIVVCASLLLAVGCTKSADEQDKAVEAQQEANQKIGEAQEKAGEKVDAAQREADEKSAEAINQANKDAAEAQAKANEQIRDVKEDVLKARNDLREHVQKELDSIGKDIDDATVKAQKATAQKKADFQVAIGDANAKREALRNEMQNIQGDTVAAVDSMKASFDQRIDELKKSVDNAKSIL